MSELVFLYESMAEALTKLTGKPAYKYRAFELLVTLDLGTYKATRRIIVPADIEFEHLHKVLQSIFGWENRHLYNFTIDSAKKHKPDVRMVLFEDYVDNDESAILMKGHTLSEFLPECKHLLYTYDLGDYWEHEIQLARVIEEYEKESPYLLESSGQSPPEDVGGVSGFVTFREIIMNPDHPEHQEAMDWSGYWTIELRDWTYRPRVIHV